jgi:acetyl esterase/lipase
MLAATTPETARRESPARRRQALIDLARIVEDEASEGFKARDLPGPAGPIPIRIYSPSSPASEPSAALVFFHGGGWVAGGFDTHGGFCRRLAEASHCRVIAVDYRLAPEHPFPAALDDALAAISWIAHNAEMFRVDPMRLAIGGDSAGAMLAASVCQGIKAQGGPPIAAQLLICPILALEPAFASRRDFAEGYFLNSLTMEQDLDDYCPPSVDRADPRLNPLNAAELTRLPPALFHTAEYDPFRDEGEAYATRLNAAGVPATLTRHDGMIHYFYAMPRAIPHALTAATMIGGQLRQVLVRV